LADANYLKGWPTVPFTAEEIENKEFLITLRGYDKDEVKAFLRAVAADFKAASDLAPSAAPDTGGSDAFQALGADIGHVLQVAKQSADGLKAKAEQDATSMRKRAEEEAKSLRDAASNAARRLTEEAERHAVQVRATAEREADDRTRDSQRRVERLQSVESKLRQRLYALEMMLQTMRQELEEADTSGEGKTEGVSTTPAMGVSAAEDSDSPPPPPDDDDLEEAELDAELVAEDE
jgi:DivIVA domain-containing protein